MMGVEPMDSDHPDFVEVDPDGRYGRYNEILGKGASKTVYRAFDEYEGVEVAWNQVKLSEFHRSPEDLERLYCEIHLLKTLKHKNIMKLYTSWVDTSKRNINFVTELFTSGTLRQYRQKHKRVHMRAVKHWCRQILRGLLYLHSHDPPIIHRDLKCDNIFINGNQGVVKIGDLGLAAILRKPHAARCVGTSEFMAPEVYEEHNESVDIYAFGMCVLEMLTFEYPYSECAHPAQIHKKLISGSKPEALSRVEDTAVRCFVEKCLAAAWQRLSARELLEDPFLRIDEQGSESWEGDIGKMCQIVRQPSYNLLHTNGSSIATAFGGDLKHELRTENGRYEDGSLVPNEFDDDPLRDVKAENGWDYNTWDFETHGIELFSSHDDDPLANVDITIKGRMTEDGGIFLRLRIAENEGRVRNIYFPFNIGTDTAVGVAAEMVGELDITDHDVTRIAEMINGEVSSLVHEWNPGPGTEEMPGFSASALADTLPSNVSSCGSLHNYISEDTSGCEDCAAMHGRFEEITYQVEGSEKCASEGTTVLSTGQSKVFDSSSPVSRESHSDQGGGQFDRSSNTKKETQTTSETQTGTRECVGQTYSDSIQRQFIEAPESRYQHSPPAPNMSDDGRIKTREELRWLTSKRQMKLRDRRNQQSGERRDFDYRESRVENGVTVSSACTALQSSSEKLMKSFQSGKHFSFRIPPRRNLLQTTTSFADISTGHRYGSRPDLEAQSPQNPDGSSESMSTAKRFYAGVHLPSSICRTKSLPVDAVERNM